GEVYEIGLREALPIIPVPLNLPDLFREVYEGARYRLQLDYEQVPSLRISKADQAWVDTILAERFS
ncbi:MAG: DUF4058 family protein, partial [Anaerolineae bacterium]|nr:DUF4058 family protein [Anaerolineae bacterium]